MQKTPERGVAPREFHVLERKTGFEPATFSLARRCSTTEPLPHTAMFDSDRILVPLHECVKAKRTLVGGVLHSLRLHGAASQVHPWEGPRDAVTRPSCRLN